MSSERVGVEVSNVATILVAADEAALVASLRNLLEGQEFDVLTASSGEAVH